jgi:hypothetical protein
MIETKEAENKWKFVYMGANQDAIKTGQAFGMRSANSVTYAADSEHVKVAYMNVSNNISKFRSSKMDFMNTVSFDGLRDVDMEKLSNDLSFTDDQRQKSV